MEDIYAGAGREMVTDTEYDFTQEYLKRISGADYIPVRKAENYIPRRKKANHRNYSTPLMQSINKSRFNFQV